MTSTNHTIYPTNPLNMISLDLRDTYSAAPELWRPLPEAGKTSPSYVPIATGRVMEHLFKAGFETIKIQRPKHGTSGGRVMVTMINRHNPILLADQTFETAVIMNSLDGTKSLQIATGAIRGACFNTLVFGAVNAETRIIHKGEKARDFELVMAEFMRDRARTEIAVNETTKRFATFDLAMALIDKARELRPVLNNVAAPELLRHRRTADKANSVWNVFNRVQECLISGGADYDRVRDGHGRKIRAIKSPLETARLNSALWSVVTGHMIAA